jgi:colanic acid/amylovoran biosynthesis glycosyltransferase
MRIAFFVNFFPAISETFILNQITGLIDRGHTIDIFSFVQNKTRTIHPIIKRYQLMKQIRFFDSIPRALVRFAFHSIFLMIRNYRWLPSRAFEVSVNALNRNVRWIPLRTAREFFLMPRNNHYDILHCQFGEIGATILHHKKIGSLHGKIITSFRGHDGTKLLDAQPGKYDELYVKGDFFLPVSHSLERRLIEDGCDPKKIRIHRSGIDLSKFLFAERKLKDNEIPRVLTVARLVERKGISYALQAIAELKRRGRRVVYTIAGDGESRASLEALIRDLNLTNDVQLLGWCDHEKVCRIMADSHLLVCPSVVVDGDEEGVPNAIKEAMAMGLPVIGTMNGGTSELIEDGVSGFLVPQRDVGAIVDRLAYLLNHPDQWPVLGRNGSEHVKRHYDSNHLNDELIEIYQRLLTVPSSR